MRNARLLVGVVFVAATAAVLLAVTATRGVADPDAFGSLRCSACGNKYHLLGDARDCPRCGTTNELEG